MSGSAITTLAAVFMYNGKFYILLLNEISWHFVIYIVLLLLLQLRGLDLSEQLAALL